MLDRDEELPDDLLLLGIDSQSTVHLSSISTCPYFGSHRRRREPVMLTTKMTSVASTNMETWPVIPADALLAKNTAVVPIQQSTDMLCL